MARFRRTYRLVVGPAGGEGMAILPPLQIQFDLEKDAEEDPNIHTIRVYNLKESTRKALEKPDLRAYLYAGYEEESGPILIAAGSVVDAFTRFASPDVITELSIADGYGELRDCAVSLSYGAGASSATIIEAVAKQMGLVLNMPRSIAPRVWEHGFAFYGPARGALHKVCGGAGLEWSVQNQTLQVVRSRGTTERSVVVLNAGSGLLGSPERVRQASREKETKEQRKARGKRKRAKIDGWRVTSLLLPFINPGDRVKLDSREVKGVWRVDAVAHTGDFHGGEWLTEMHLMEQAE